MAQGWDVAVTRMWLLPVDLQEHRWVTLLFDYAFFPPGLPPASWLSSPVPQLPMVWPFLSPPALFICSDSFLWPKLGLISQPGAPQ